MMRGHPRRGGNPGTTPGVYTLTVTGTYASGSTTLTHSVSLTLQVNRQSAIENRK
jgi:uridine kinase